MKIVFTGDLFLGHEPINIEYDINQELNKGSYLVSNFENVIENSRIAKRTDKSSILTFSKENLIKYCNFFTTNMVFTLGNNHIHDLGEEGLKNTMECIESLNIKYTGIGFNNDIEKSLVLKKNNISIALLNVTTDEPEVMSLIATETDLGTFHIDDPSLLQLISSIKSKVNYLVILPHWGREYIYYPHHILRKKAYQWIDFGADMVIGHHPHIIQGKEIYKGKNIYYSLGNYIFPNFYNKHGIYKKWNAENNHSILLTVSFGSTINVKETGLVFDTKNLILKGSNKSIVEFTNKCTALDLNKLDAQQYYELWEMYYTKKISKQYSKINKYKTIYLSKRKNSSIICYLFKRLLSKVKRNVFRNKS